jgi:N-acetylglucosamine-6-phosphate deacetylase
MERLVLEPARLLDPEARTPERGALLIEGGRIASRLAPGAAAPPGARRVALPELALAPGFLDLHYHGALVFTAPERAGPALQAAAQALPATGVTGFLPTTVTWPAAELGARLAAWAREAAALAAPDHAAAVLGLHLEGPWIRPEAAGAQPRAGIRPYRAADAELLDRTEGLARLVTLAPETEGARELLAELGRRGVVASLGHSLADAASCERAIGDGARHVTHLFNAMGTFHHRAPGLIGTALADGRVSCDLICDGAHVHPAAVRVAARAKRESLVLITDNVAPPSVGENANALASFGAGPLQDDGVALRLPDGTLAGSRLTLDRALANAQAFEALTLLEAVRALSLAPARVLGLERERGSLRPGARADFAMLGPDGVPEETWVAGRPVWRRGGRP